jgi:hypothetical protein
MPDFKRISTGSVAVVLENPQMRGIPVTRFTRINHIQQPGFIDSTLILRICA